MDIKQLNGKVDDETSDPVDRLLQDRKPASSGRSIAVLALLVALASVSATAWQWWQTRLADPDAVTQKESLIRLQESQIRLQEVQEQYGNSMLEFEEQLNARQSPIDAAEFSRRNERIKAVENQLKSLHGQSGEDQASISALQAELRSLEQRLSATESGLVNVAANSQNSGVALDIAEIDFLLRTASERLSLFSDPISADLALRAADVQIEALNDPMFLSVRQRIATAREMLAALPDIDRVQLTARLGSMQSKIPGLPIRGEVEPQQQAADLPEDAGWWESFKHSLSSLVTVRRRVPEEQSLLSLEDKDYLRQGLWLQFESARLALERNDASNWAGSLDRVDKTVRQFFQNDSPVVQALLSDVAALKQVNIAPEMPDISAPWTQLRQLRDSRRLLQSASPVESAAPQEATGETEPPEHAPVESEGSGA